MEEQERSGSRGQSQSQSQGGWVVDWGEGSAEQRSAPTNKPQYPQSPITELPNYSIYESDAEAPVRGFTENVPETKKPLSLTATGGLSMGGTVGLAGP